MGVELCSQLPRKEKFTREVCALLQTRKKSYANPGVSLWPVPASAGLLWLLRSNRLRGLGSAVAQASACDVGAGFVVSPCARCRRSAFCRLRRAMNRPATSSPPHEWGFLDISAKPKCKAPFRGRTTRSAVDLSPRDLAMLYANSGVTLRPVPIMFGFAKQFRSNHLRRMGDGRKCWG